MGGVHKTVNRHSAVPIIVSKVTMIPYRQFNKSNLTGDKSMLLDGYVKVRTILLLLELKIEIKNNSFATIYCAK